MGNKYALYRGVIYKVINTYIVSQGVNIDTGVDKYFREYDLLELAPRKGYPVMSAKECNVRLLTTIEYMRYKREGKL